LHLFGGESPREGLSGSGTAARRKQRKAARKAVFLLHLFGGESPREGLSGSGTAARRKQRKTARKAVFLLVA